MAYVTQQAVLEEAGLWARELGETPAGAANGSNTVFTVAHKPLADNDYNDSVTKDDVTAYVDGTSVGVSSVNATTGAITLTAAPSADKDVTIDYSYTSVSTAFVADVIEEASDVIDDELSQVTTTPFTTVPKTVRLIARTLAAGLLLAREYGLQADEEGVKQGTRKIELAERWLASYRTRLESNSADDGDAIPRSNTERRLFQRYSSEDGAWVPLTDEHFRVNEVD